MITFKKNLMKIMAMAAMGLVVVACGDDDLFTEQDVTNNAEKIFGVSIDPTHDWKMTQEVTANVTVNLGKDDAYTVLVFDKSPFDNEDAVYFAKQKVSDVSITKLDLSVPSYLTELYVTVLESDNRSRSKHVAITDNLVDVVFGTAMEGSFSRRTRGNTGVDYPATSGHINANGNEWAASTTGNNPKTYGGWVVPDTLTNEQKAVVRAYFQANPKLTYKDPEWRHFFVQQVYKGGTAQSGASNENIVAASGAVYNSTNMGELYVGPRKDESYKINAFGSGDASYYGNVLDNGQDVNTGTHHRDQIMLMVNIDDTSTFTYTNSGSSSERNNKCALVSWETIRTWANSHGLNGDCLKDGWNRSFLGFDIALKSLEDSYAKNGNDIIYAKMSDGQNGGLQYVWDGTNVVQRKNVEGSTDLNLIENYNYSFWNGSETATKNSNGTLTYNAATWGGLAYWFGDVSFSQYQSIVVEFAQAPTVTTKLVVKIANQWNNEWENSVEANAGATKLEFNLSGIGDNYIRQIALQAAAAGPIQIKSFYFKGQEAVAGFGDFLLVDGQKVPFLDANKNMYAGEKYGNRDEAVSDGEMRINKDNKDCFNMVKIKELVKAGYLPVKDSNLRTWVKWQDSDGYFSDWIVTLTKANRTDGEESHEEEFDQNPAVYTYAFEDTFMGDYDMNDVVMQVWEDAADATKLNVKLCCTGASYDLYVFLRVKDENNPNEYVDLKLFGGTEVHTLLRGSSGKYINTGTGDKFQTRNPYTTQIDKPANYNPEKADFWVKSPAGDIHVGTIGNTKQIGNAPYGVRIPVAWAWPNEWTPVSKAYSEFTNWAQNKETSKAWYLTPVEGKVRTE